MRRHVIHMYCTYVRTYYVHIYADGHGAFVQYLQTSQPIYRTVQCQKWNLASGFSSRAHRFFHLCSSLFMRAHRLPECYLSACQCRHSSRRRRCRLCRHERDSKRNDNAVAVAGRETHTHTQTYRPHSCERIDGLEYGRHTMIIRPSSSGTEQARVHCIRTRTANHRRADRVDGPVMCRTGISGHNAADGTLLTVR